MAVVTPQDRPAAMTVAERLARHQLTPVVCTGGAPGADVAPDVRELASSIGAAARELDELTHESRLVRSAR